MIDLHSRLSHGISSTQAVWHLFLLKKKPSFKRGKCTFHIISQLSVMCTWGACFNGLGIVATAFAVGEWMSIDLDEPRITTLSPRLPGRICQFCDFGVSALSNGRYSTEPVSMSSKRASSLTKACGKSPLRACTGSPSYLDMSLVFLAQMRRFESCMLKCNGSWNTTCNILPGQCTG